MIIKHLRLKNIRSFESLDLTFNKDITLLSGDIGSGKTTILLSIEFALFGLLRGKVSPEEILRHGEQEGHINLEFEINNKEISITRYLKRTSSTIVQPPGHILIDGQETEMVTTELKAKILELMGYPPTLINKSTNLFRYTVYTPQEQVKLILFESIEERKDVIRKIFALDKYKTIASNLAPYQSNLKSNIERNLGKLEELPILKEQKSTKSQEIENLSRSINKQTETFQILNKEKLELQNKLQSLQKQNEEFQKNKSKLNLIIQKQNYLQNTLNTLNEEEIKLNNQIKSMEFKEISFDEEKKEALNKLLTSFEEKRIKFSQKEGELNAKQSHISKITDSIKDLEKCPTCRQEVSSEHKDKIQLLQTKSLEKLNEREIMITTATEKLLSNISKVKEHLEKIVLKEKEFNQNKEKKKLFQSYQERLVSIKEKQISQLRLIDEEKQNKTDIDVLLKYQEEIKFEKEKFEFEHVQRDERKAELELKSQQTRLDVAKKHIDEITKEIILKESLKLKNQKLSQIKNWISDMFLPLLSTIERKVMLKVHQEFNNLFIKWFEMLIDDQSIHVRLDENFTPLLEQNGFDTNIDNLSGGEKTSVALAYRLALNKVLNDYFSKIHTKELLILDEPTDGFSSEQLDKLNLVLSDIDAKQVIIVSHEQKLESLAQNIIKVEKANHISQIYI